MSDQFSEIKDGPGWTIMFPDGTIEGSLSHKDAERKCKAWFKKHLPDSKTVDIGMIDWRS